MELSPHVKAYMEHCFGESSLWTHRVNIHHLKGRNIQDVGLKHMCWSWRIIMKIRHKVRFNLKNTHRRDYFELIFDNWHGIGPLTL